MTYGLRTLGECAYSVEMELGKHLKALREAKGWSKAELARRSGLNLQTIFRIEHGISQGGWQSRKKIAQALGISVAELDQKEEEPPNAPRAPSSTAVVPAPQSLSDEQILQAVFAYVRELERRGGSDDSSTPPAPEKEPPARPSRTR